MNATEILWQAARVGEKRALPILSVPAAKALGIMPMHSTTASSAVRERSLFFIFQILLFCG